MSGRDGGPWGVLRDATRQVRRQALLTVALSAVSLLPLLLLVAWSVGDGWTQWSVGPLMLVVLGLVGAVVVVVVLVRRWVSPVTEAAVAAAAERRHGLAEGSIRGVLELGRGLPAGTSAALYRRTERELAARLTGASPADLAGDVGARSRGRRTTVLALAAGLAALASLAGFATPDRAREGWMPLLHPVVHLRGPVLPPLTVRPGDTEVARGRMLELEVDAPLRSRVSVEWRAAGDVPRARGLEVIDGVAIGSVGPVEGPLEYRVRAPDGARTGWFGVVPVDPLLLAGLDIQLVYPPHVGRDPDRLDGEVAPSLSVPDGTLLRVRGMATRELDGASFRRADGEERAAATSGRGFSLDWRTDRGAAGTWELHLLDGDGSSAQPTSLELTVVADGPPRVRILVPGSDTLLSPTRRQPLVAEAADDHGLTRAEIVYRRVGARGARGPVARLPLPVEPGVQRALIRGVLDVNAEPLVPGDAVEYHIVVRDNSPSGQVARSDTYLLRLPSAADLRERATSEAEDLVRDAGRMADQARALERAGRELSRRVAAEGRAAGAGGDGVAAEKSTSLDFRRATEARQLADAQDDARRELEELRQRLQQLRELVAEAGLADGDLERRLDQLSDLYRDLTRAEIAREADAIRDAADALDAAALTAELQRMLARQEEMRERLEESLDLLREAALEHEMAALAREAEEIAAQQEALAATMRDELGDRDGTGTADSTASGGVPPGEPDEPEEPEEPGAGDAGSEPVGSGGEEGGDDGAEARARQQEELAARTARLTQLIESLQQHLLQRGDDQSASQAGSAQDEGRSAQQAMEEAAEQARQQRGEEAASSGEQAAGHLSSAARSLDEARGQRADAARREAQEAIRQATQDALRLAEREEALRQQMEDAQAGGGDGGADGGGGGDGSGELQRMQSEQMAVQQGLQQLGRNLSEGSRSAGTVDRDVAQALARAMLDLEHTLDGLQAGRSMPVHEAGRAVESLNRLAMALLNADDPGRRSTAAGLAEALRRITELAQEQGALNAQVGALAPLDIPGRTETQQLQQLAEQQRGVARRVGDVSGLLGGREDVLGRLDELSVEAAAIARELEGGRVEPEVRARQERLFHRLLDAGRSLEREEYTEERAGRMAERQEPGSPEPLDPAHLDSALRYPGPTAQQLRELAPAYRRLVLEYFERLNSGAAEPATDPLEGGRP